MKHHKILFIGSILLLWQIVVSLNIVSPLVLPSLFDVIRRLWEDILSGSLPLSLFYSLLIIAIAFSISLFGGFLLALGSLHFPLLDQFLENCSALAHPLPALALLPLFILWTGLGVHIIILIVIHSVLWPVYINLRSGFHNVPKIWRDLGRNNGLSTREEFFHILLPASYPSFLSALKIGWARSWRAVISAEMIFGTIGEGGGLGWYIFNKRIFMDTPGMYGGILVLMIMGLIIDDLLFAKLEKRGELYGGGYDSSKG